MAKGTGIFGTTLSAVFFGLSMSAILSIIFSTSNSVEFSLTTLFENMTITGAASLNVYWIILLSWTIAGIVAGVRAKDPIVGGLGAFFAAFLVVVLTALIFVTPDILNNLLALDFNIDITPLIEPLPGFAIGAAGAVIIAAIFGYGSGRSTSEPTKKIPKPKSRKSWTRKEQWKCDKCGHDLPPGAMRCPNCGKGVIQ